MKNGNLLANNVENYNTNVGQASRLSYGRWRRYSRQARRLSY